MAPREPRTCHVSRLASKGSLGNRVVRLPSEDPRAPRHVGFRDVIGGPEDCWQRALEIYYDQHPGVTCVCIGQGYESAETYAYAEHLLRGGKWQPRSELRCQLSIHTVV